MTRSDACSEAEWIAETIIDDFAASLDMSDRVTFYARLVELLTARRDGVQRDLEGDGLKPDTFQQVH